MIAMVGHILSAVYLLCAMLLALYTLGQVILLVQYLRQRSFVTPPNPDDWPQVTIQLPIYNEKYVVRRLLRAVGVLDYPRDRLHIQLLDDSTDETQQIAAAEVARLRRAGVYIAHVRRADRSGYKAGALAAGLAQTNSPFIAIFDADFVPPRDFLRRTLPHLLADERLGFVQTRWAHLNAEHNALTRAQRLAVDTHFVIEQAARSGSGWLMPFNGTGGVWRAATIHDAGGWSARTLTEDLDLSYRAQLRGWRARLLPQVIVPGELPVHLAAYAQQQARWAAGSTQNLRWLLGHVWRAPLRLSNKLMATHHLCQYVPQPLMLIMLLLAPPLLLIDRLEVLPLAPLGLLGLAPPLMYTLTQRALRSDWLHTLRALPVLVLLGTGLIAHNSRAMLKSLRLSDALPFERTPKFGQKSHSADAYHLSVPAWARIESLLALYAMWGVALALTQAPGLVPYLLLHALAFLAVLRWRWQDARRIEQARTRARVARSTD